MTISDFAFGYVIGACGGAVVMVAYMLLVMVFREKDNENTHSVGG